VAALSLYRWARHRDGRDAALALFFAACCPLIKIPGWIWAATLIPGLVMALFPRRGLRLVAGGLAAVVLIFVLLARTAPVIMGYRLHLDFEPGWRSLADSLFLFGNWNVLWYGVIAVAVLAWRRLFDPVVAPLVVIVITGLGFLFAVFAFTNATAYVADFTTVNRAALHLAPLLIVVCVLLWDNMRRTEASADRLVAEGAD
jgi:hypothetical protein